MIQHIKELAETFIAAGHNQAGPMYETLLAFRDEVQALEVKDFAPAMRTKFLVNRARLTRRLVNGGMPEPMQVHPMLREILTALDQYGPLAQPPSRVFRWLSDADHREIVERDYIEVSQLTLPHGAWKSTVIMAGSITEAILFDLLTKDSGNFAKAQASLKVPTKAPPPGAPPGTVPTKLPAKKWSLEDLIAIATDIGLIPAARASTFDQVLRDYRNFVHPAKELRAAHHCGEGEALMAKGALDALCDHFDRTLP